VSGIMRIFGFFGCTRCRNSSAQEPYRNLAIRPGEQSRQQDHFHFSPGPLGVGLHLDTGTVSRVHEGGQAEALGVQKGWVIDEVGGLPYTSGVLRNFQEGKQPYSILFTRNETLWQHAVARASRGPEDSHARSAAFYCHLCVETFREPRTLQAAVGIMLIVLLIWAAIYGYTQWAYRHPITRN
jgi:hypothetical protein